MIGGPISLCFCCVHFSLTSQSAVSKKYQPNWSSLDSRPLPIWYDKSKFGIFMHWSMWSVPSYGPPGATESAFFWMYWKKAKNPLIVKFMHDNYRPDFTYQNFAAQFHAELFDPRMFARIIRDSGAKYVVLTSKHCEGYTMWPSNYSWNWNSMDVGPNKDLVGELRDAILKIGGVHFGLYYAHLEWFNPLYLKDKSNSYQTQEYVKAVTNPQLHEIIDLYKPDILWSDAAWEPQSPYWNSTEFLAWLYNDSPVKDNVITNDRWGNDAMCHHGGFYTCKDKFDPGHLVSLKWENCMTTDSQSWGFRRTMTYEHVLSIEQLIEKLARTISCGGNLLLNVGPTADGRIIPIFEERLIQMGQWLKINGEAVYETKPWIYQNDTVTANIWYRVFPNLSPGLIFQKWVFDS